MDPKGAKKVFSRLAKVYDLFNGFQLAPGRRKAVELLELQPADEVLELGIGTGLTLPNYPAHIKLTGIDISEEMLAKAHSRVQQCAMPYVKLQCMNAMELSFANDCFDKAVSAYLVALIPDPVALAKEICRVVRPGGTVVFTSHFKSKRKVLDRIEAFFGPIRYLLGYGHGPDLEQILSNTPLEVEHIEKDRVLGYWTYIKCRNCKPHDASTQLEAD